ncbi:MAG TPA: hypothetical protein VHZ24_00855 [Pirellulales bacterium]|jgi:hypothetical protein|nr:hypothetical protein [Pirellulales bacterium]
MPRPQRVIEQGNARPLVNRTTVGILAVVLLAIGIATVSFAPPTSMYEQLASAGLRLGAVLAMLWIALPDLQAARKRWLVMGLLAVVALIVVVPRIPVAKLLPLLAIVWIAFAWVRPRRRDARK